MLLNGSIGRIAQIFTLSDAFRDARPIGMNITPIRTKVVTTWKQANSKIKLINSIKMKMQLFKN